LGQLQSLDSSICDCIESVVQSARKAGLKLYDCKSDSLQPTSCIGTSEHGLERLVGHGCCSACAAVLIDKKTEERASRPCSQPDAPAAKKINHAHLNQQQALDRLKQARDVEIELFRQGEHEKRKRIAAERKSVRLEAKMTAAIKKGNYPKFIRAFKAASDEGIVPDEALQVILTDIAKSMRGKHKWSGSSKSFYRSLLNCGDPWVVKFVSVNLLGMDIRTVEKDRSNKSGEFIEGQVKENMRRGAKMLEDYGMTGVPCAVTEDATSTLTRLDGLMKKSTDTGLWEI
jgi:hypothetical protein